MRLSLRAGSASSSGSGSGSGSESGAMQALKSLVGSLSLVLANYKPTPVLPANTTSVSNVPLPGGSSAGGGSGGSFLVAGQSNNGTGKGLNLPHQDLDPTQWGSPSTVYVSSGWAGPQIQPGGDSLASTVGPGGCKIQGAYSPSEHLPSATDFPDFDRTKANIMRYRKQVGVNLGSWFVLENWMVPSMFNCARHAASSEHDVLAGYGTSKGGVESARARLEQHWDTWVTKKDFARMAAMGINTVRIPVGYWMMGEDKWLADTPFAAWREVYRNELRYLARAIGWAAAHDMGVLIDLHGAYGSQNGQAHSGVSDGKINFFTGHRNMQRTTDLLVELTQRYANVTNVVGIEALNEPNQGYRSQVYKWYPKAMDAMRRAHNPEAKTLPIFFHDAFSLRAGAQYVASRKDFVVQDNHRYVVYSPSDQRASASEHTTTIEGTVASELRGRSRTARNNLVVGEWSCALAGSSLSGARDAHAAQHRFCNAQAKVYEQATAGWAFWSWRLESCDQNAGWCFQATEHTKLLTSPLHAWSHAGGGGSAGKGKKGKGKGKKGKGKGKGKKKSSSRSVAEGGESGMDATELRTLVAQDVEAMDGPELPYGAAGGRPAASAGAASAGGVRRGTGSAAARARAALERDVAGRTLTAAEAVGNRGFHDGYTSAKVFAASAASLSQLGFGGQYVADSYGAHVTSRALEHSGAHEAAYHTHFAAGLAAAEAKIAALVQQHAQGGV